MSEKMFDGESGDLVAARKRQVERLLSKLYSLKQARDAVTRERASASPQRDAIVARFQAIADDLAVAVLEEAIALCEAGAVGPLLPAADIEALWKQYGEPGTAFHDILGDAQQVSARAQLASLMHVLNEAYKEARKIQTRPAAGQPVDEPPAWVAPVIRICAATAIGALAGAPLAAFVVREDVVIEMVKTGTGTLVAAIGVESTNPMVERISRPSEGKIEEASAEIADPPAGPPAPDDESRKPPRIITPAELEDLDLENRPARGALPPPSELDEPDDDRRSGGLRRPDGEPSDPGDDWPRSPGPGL